MEKDQILAEIKKEGMLGPFWISVSSVPHVLETYWRSFSDLLNSGVIPKQTESRQTDSRLLSRRYGAGGR